MAGKIQTKTFSGGMNKDLDFSLLKENQYIDAQNYKLISSEEANGFVFENAEGNESWIDISAVSGLDDTYYLVGHCYIKPHLVLFYTTTNVDRTPSGGTSKIVKYHVIKDKVQDPIIIYDDSTVTGSLDFSTTFPISAVGHYESGDNIKVYWADGYNDVRWMNIMDVNLATYDVNMLDLTPDFPFNTTTSNAIRMQFNEYTQGNIDCSAIQYAYQYYIPNGPSTVYSPASAMIQMPRTNSLSGEVVAGGNKDEDSGYGVTMDVLAYNSNFVKVRFVAIEYDSYNGVPAVRLFSERDLTADTNTTLSVTDTGKTISEITYDEYLVQTNISFSAKDLAIKDNYLFAGNIREESFDVDVDCRAYRHNAAGVARLYESNLSSYIDVDDGVLVDFDAVPATHDCINLHNKSVYNSTADEYSNQYIFQADGTTIGAEGENIEIGISTNTSDVIDTIGTSSLDKWTASTFLYEPGQRTWARNEVYRIGLIFRNAKMQPSPVKWICDFKIPPVYETETTTNYGITSSSSTITRRRIAIYAAYTSTWATTEATSFELVAVPRSSTDRSILGQGLIQHTLLDSSTSTYFPSHSMASEGFTYTSGTVTESDALVRFISPEISFNKNLEFQSGDFIHYLGYFSWLSGNRDTSGTGIFNEKVYYHTTNASTLAAAQKEELDDVKVIGYVADDEYRTTVGGKEYQPYVVQQFSSDAGGACTTHGCLSVTGGNLTGWWSGNTGRMALANYKRDVFQSQYGGIDYYSRQNNTYISVSDPEVPYIGTPATVSYEGDTFIDWFFYNNACLDLDNTATTTQAASFLFPVESSISLSHRLDDGLHRNLGSLAAVLTQEIAGTWESDVVDATTRTWEQETALYQYNPVYSQQNNAAFYLADNDNTTAIENYPTRIKYSEFKINGEELDSFTIFKPNNFIDLNGKHGSLHNLKIFKNNLYFWQDSAFGIASVNARSLIQDNQPGILALGTGGILSRIDYISDSIGNQNQFGIAISESGIYWVDNNKNEFYKYDGSAKALSKLGGIQSWINSQGEIGDAKVVYDSKYNDVLFTITFARDATCESTTAWTDGINTVGLNYSISPYLDLNTANDYNIKMEGAYPYDDDVPYQYPHPVQNTMTYSASPDQWRPNAKIFADTTDDIYITIDNDSEYTYTISFNEITDSFVSFHSFIPGRYIELDNDYLSTDDYHDLWIHNSGIRGNYYSSYYDSTFTTVFNKDFPYTKVWDGLKWYNEAVQTDTNTNMFKQTFTTINMWNDYQCTGDRYIYYKGDTPPATRPTEIVRRDRTFSMQIPRNIVDANPSLTFDPTSSTNWTEANTFKDRMRDKYMVLKTTYDNEITPLNFIKLSIPFISSVFRKSIR